MRYTIRSKVSHLLRTLPPNTASHHFDLLHSELLNAHLNVRPQFHSVSHESDQSFTLSSPHLDVRKVCSLLLALGGHGLLPFNLNPSPLQHSNPPINHSQSDLALKTPDLVLQDFHAPRTFTIIDIKIVDPSAASYVKATAKSALHRHRALEAAGPRDYFGPSRRPPPGARMRV